MLSLLAIDSVAVLLPVVVGAKRTVNDVVLPDATVAEGCVVTLNSLALAPLSATTGVPVRLSVWLPVLRIVNVVEVVPCPAALEPKLRVPPLARAVPAGCSKSNSGPLNRVENVATLE